MTSTVQAYFQRSGYRVDVENDPNRAIERIRNGSYDILLLDFLMTPICGDQVVAQVRQFNQDIFIILLTGHKSMAPPIKTIRALDIQGYYEKSDRFDQLEQMVNHKKRTEPQPAPAAKPIKPVVVETPAPRSRLKRILDFFKLRR